MKSPEPDLFGVRKTKPKKTPPVPDGAVQRLITRYVDGYEQRFGEKPVFTKGDAALLKGLIVQFGEEIVEKRLGAFLAWDNSFAAKRGYTIRTLHSMWNELTSQVITDRILNPRWVCPHTPHCGSPVQCEKYKLLNAARRKAGKPLLVEEK